MMTILGVDLDENHEVILRLTSGSTVAELGRANVAPDRSLTATATIPTDFPRGYAELSAIDPGGSIWSTQILVGDRAEGPDAQAGDGAALDDRAIGLALAGIGTVLFLLAATWYVRGRPRGPSRPNGAEA